MANAPRGREKNVTGQGKDVYKRGSGNGGGPVGNGGGYSGRPGGSGKSSGGSNGGKRAGGGMNPLILIILAVLFLGGGGGLSSLLGGGSSTSTSTGSGTSGLGGLLNEAVNSSSSSQPSSSGSFGQTVTGYPQASSVGVSGMSTDLLSQLLGGGGFSGSGVSSSGWSRGSNVGKLDQTVAAGSRAKRTKIKGNGKDTVTIMVYMCGADLESRSGMGTSDLQEIAAANLGSNVNILVYTGGASQWKNNVISNKTTQIYKVENGGFKRLESDMGNIAMTEPKTLAEFIRYCGKYYPANRNELIFWDHGSGSISGYGYDEKFRNSGSMDLKEISEALKSGGVTFDFIGFDACLMATVENGLMLAPYADYMIASEETEPGIGWYYTNWLNKLASNTSMPTIEVGKNIADDFVAACGQKCPGQGTTLSVVDLAELANTVPAELKAFSKASLQQIQNKDYKTISDARSSAREFATSAKIDQVDMVSFATNIGSDEAESLAQALLGAVKYNKTSSNMPNSYGLSIFFPQRKVSMVNTANTLYSSLGMVSEYTKFIEKFAGLQSEGQAISGGTSSPFGSLFDMTGALSGSGSSSGSYGSSSGSYGSSSSGSYGSSSGSLSVDPDMVMDILSQLLGGGTGNISGLTQDNSSFFGRSIDLEADAEYLTENHFYPEQLIWLESSEEVPAIFMPDDQWALIQDVELNLFMDDGQGYIDMGLDTIYEFTEDGGLSGAFDGTWLAINNQPVAYYHTSTVEDGDNYTITGYVPAKLNGERVNLILVFDNENPYGYIAGAEMVYDDDIQVLAKNLTELEPGDTLDFLCDYYSYDNEFQDNYELGDQMIVGEEMEISNVYVDASRANACYRFTDIYQQHYWSPVMEVK